MDGGWKRYVVADPANGGMPAAAFDHPVDWRPDSRVLWNIQHTMMPVQLFARADGSDGMLAFESLPMQGFGWSDAPMGLAMPGENLDGIIRMAPPAPEAAIRSLLIPAWRGQAANLQILAIDISEMEPPRDARMPNARTSAHKLKARISYQHAGKPVEEIFHATMPVITAPPAAFGMPAFTSWQLTDVLAYRAAEGKLDAARPLFERIEKSWEMNPHWKAAVQQRIQQLMAGASRMTDQLLEAGRVQTESYIRSSNEFIQRGRDYVAGQQARVNAMANPVYTGTTSTFSASEMMGGESSGGGSDYSAHDQRIDSIYERQTVDNPANSANNKIGADADHVWRNHDGDLLGSDDPNFDPNTGDQFGNWTRAPIKRPGG